MLSIKNLQDSGFFDKISAINSLCSEHATVGGGSIVFSSNDYVRILVEKFKDPNSMFSLSMGLSSLLDNKISFICQEKSSLREAINNNVAMKPILANDLASAIDLLEFKLLYDKNFAHTQHRDLNSLLFAMLDERAISLRNRP